MLNLIVSSAVLVAVAIKEWATSKGPAKWLIIFICAGAFYTTIDSYLEGEKRSGQLEKIGSVEDTVNYLSSQARALDTVLALLRVEVDTLGRRRKALGREVRELQDQLVGELIHIPGETRQTQAGLFERTDRFQSRYTRALKDISIFLRFNRQFEHLTITEGSQGAAYLSTCQTVDTSFRTNTIDYSCPILGTGHWIEFKTRSRQEIRIDSLGLWPVTSPL